MKYKLITALVLLGLLVTPASVFAQGHQPPTSASDPRISNGNPYWVRSENNLRPQILKDNGTSPAIPTVDAAPAPQTAVSSELIGSTSVLNGNFEQGQNVNWTESSSNGYDVVVPYMPDDSLTAHSGIWIAWLGDDNYETTTLSQSNLTIPSDGAIRLWYWSASGDDCGYDYGTVKINSNTVYTWNLCYDTNTYGWTPLQIDISSYSGQTVTLTFQVTTDVGYPSDLLIDDVSLAIGKDKVSVGVFRPTNGVIYLKNSNFTGYADIALNYGIPNDKPVTGDWNGDGIDTIGIFRNGVFYLRNSNTVGVADISFRFGQPGDQPIAGDWNHDGVDTVGVYRSSNFTFYLRNTNSLGAPDMTFRLGIPGDIGIAGDWDGDGYDTTGVFRPSNGIIYLKNTNATGNADIAIHYGIPNDKPVTGDWNSDGIDTIGILRGNHFYLRNSNTVGNADIDFALGIPGDLPIAGDWDAKP